MDWGSLTEDQLDLIITGGERQVAEIRAVQMAAIQEKRRRQSHHNDGYRSIVDWFAARADLSHQASRSICWTASRLEEPPEVAAQLANGEITFDRAEQLARLPERVRHDHEGYDIGQLRRLVAHHRRLSPRREREIASSGYLHFQPSLDETTTHIWGELAGLDARLVEKAIDQRADEVVADDVPLAVAERRALALVAICQDSLYSSDATGDSPPVDTRSPSTPGPRQPPTASQEWRCSPGRVSGDALSKRSCATASSK